MTLSSVSDLIYVPLIPWTSLFWGMLRYNAVASENGKPRQISINVRESRGTFQELCPAIKDIMYL